MGERECRATVTERAKGRCERCGATNNLTCHHRLKRSQGGKWEPANIVLVHGSGVTGCHGWIESHPLDASKEGYHVRPWQDPAEIPVLLHDGRTVLLGAEYVSSEKP